MIQQEASSHGDFNAVVFSVEQAVLAAGGWIVSHQFFSNRLAMLSFALPKMPPVDFGASLTAAGLSLHQAFPDKLPGRGEEVMVQLSITFLNQGPDLRRDVPAFG